MAEASTPGKLTWIHTDSRGLAAASAAAYSRAIGQQWSDDASSTADARMLVVQTFASAAALSPTPPVVQGGALSITPTRVDPSTEPGAWQLALMQALYVLLATNPTAAYSFTGNVRMQTEDGEPAAPPETGLAWIGAVVAIAVVGAIAAVVIDWLNERDQIAAIKLATDANVQKHAATLASANQIVSEHLDREAAAGASLPWEQHELELLDELQTSSRELAAWKAPDLKPGPIGGAVANVGGATAGAISNVSNAAAGSTDTALVLAAAVAAFWIFTHHSGRQSRAAQAA